VDVAAGIETVPCLVSEYILARKLISWVIPESWHGLPTSASSLPGQLCLGSQCTEFFPTLGLWYTMLTQQELSESSLQLSHFSGSS
jgi:hypothetical protein